jgi:hypothetical protein
MFPLWAPPWGWCCCFLCKPEACQVRLRQGLFLFAFGVCLANNPCSIPLGLKPMWILSVKFWHLAQGLLCIPEGKASLQEAAVCLAWVAAWVVLLHRYIGYCRDLGAFSLSLPPFFPALPVWVLEEGVYQHHPAGLAGACQGLFWITQQAGLGGLCSWILEGSLQGHFDAAKKVSVAIRKSSCCLQDCCSRNS